MEKITLNDRGATYGPEKSLAQLGSKALTSSTPVDGLYLAGHWEGSEHGVPGTMGSGERASELIVKAMH
jgi:phytoene dehydrogenase-like protein